MLRRLAAEYGERVRDQGATAARQWIWRQLLGSIPALLRRGWWRGWTGFEPRANDLRPGGPVFESWIMDLRFAARRLRSRPAYAGLAVLTLALGVGGTAALFSLARGLIFDPLPYRTSRKSVRSGRRATGATRNFCSCAAMFPASAMSPRIVRRIPSPAVGRTRTRRPGHRRIGRAVRRARCRAAARRVLRKGDDVVGAEPVTVLS